jgi:hypothetical protein
MKGNVGIDQIFTQRKLPKFARHQEMENDLERMSALMLAYPKREKDIGM